MELVLERGTVKKKKTSRVSLVFFSSVFVIRTSPLVFPFFDLSSETICDGCVLKNYFDYYYSR